MFLSEFITSRARIQLPDAPATAWWKQGWRPKRGRRRWGQRWVVTAERGLLYPHETQAEPPGGTPEPASGGRAPGDGRAARERLLDWIHAGGRRRRGQRRAESTGQESVAWAVISSFL
jgi:hypothetical protein